MSGRRGGSGWESVVIELLILVIGAWWDGRKQRKRRGY